MPYFQATPSISIYYIDQSPPSAPAPAKTALLIPGITCDLHDWNWQVPLLLEKGYRVISPDPRGQGRSSAPPPAENVSSYPGPRDLPGSSSSSSRGAGAPPDGDELEIIDYYPQSTAADLLALLSHLSVTRDVLILAHSLGTCAALQMAARGPPSLVAGLVLIDPLHCMPSALCDQLFADPASPALANMLHGGGELYPASVPAWHRAWITRRGMGQDERITRAMTAACWTDPEGLGRREVSVREHGAGRLRCPKLAVGSSEDWVAADRDEEALTGDAGKDEEVVISGMGHWLHQLKADEFNAVLERWLEKAGLLPDVVPAAAEDEKKEE